MRRNKTWKNPPRTSVCTFHDDDSQSLCLVLLLSTRFVAFLKRDEDIKQEQNRPQDSGTTLDELWMIVTGWHVRLLLRLSLAQRTPKSGRGNLGRILAIYKLWKLIRAMWRTCWQQSNDSRWVEISFICFSYTARRSRFFFYPRIGIFNFYINIASSFH